MTEDVDAALDFFFQAVLGKKPCTWCPGRARAHLDRDVFIICSAAPTARLSAIAEHIERQLRGCKIKPLSVEGPLRDIGVDGLRPCDHSRIL